MRHVVGQPDAVGGLVEGVAGRVLRNTLAQTALLRPDARIDALRDTLSELLSMDEPRKRFAGMMSSLDIHRERGEAPASQVGAGSLYAPTACMGEDAIAKEAKATIDAAAAADAALAHIGTNYQLCFNSLDHTGLSLLSLWPICQPITKGSLSACTPR